MKRMIIGYRAFLLWVTLFISFSCGRTGVSDQGEPTNEDAIYNIIRYDRPSEFNIDLYDFAVPETLTAGLGPIVPTYYWYELERDSLFIGIEIRYVQPGDPAGTVPVADVFQTKHFWGTFEVIGIDTSDGGQTPVRMSKEFTIVGLIAAKFEKLGFDHNYRRGWLLTRISDVVYQNGYPGTIGEIVIHSESDSDYVVDTGIKDLSDIIIFPPGDSITVTVSAVNPDDYLNFGYRSSGALVTRRMIPDGTGQYVTGFRLADSQGYNHFMVDLISSGSITDTLEFRSSAYGVLYRTR
jgi:hypothetical protein